MLVCDFLRSSCSFSSNLYIVYTSVSLDSLTLSRVTNETFRVLFLKTNLSASVSSSNRERKQEESSSRAINSNKVVV